MVLAVQENNKVQYAMTGSVPAGVFRTYDIRGPVADGAISEPLAYHIGLAFGTMAQEKGETSVWVGRDGRLTGEAIQGALIHGLRDAGVRVCNIGVVSTPMLYFSTAFYDKSSTGVMVTASHNPAADNGFKLVLDGKTLSAEGIQTIYQHIVNGTAQEVAEKRGEHNTSVLEDYIATVVSKINLSRPLKVVIDCGSGVGAVAGPEIFRRLGCEVVEMYTEIDGRFPHHHPDPTVLKNLADIMAKVKEVGADLGLAFDGDADRIGVITDRSEVIWPDRQMMLFSKDVLSRHPGEDVIFDVKCSSHLPRLIEQCGGNPIMYKTGHSLIKSEMKRRNAPLAGEMSGHVFFNDDWFGFDDGVYVAARLCQIVASQSASVSEVFAALPNSVNTPELKLPMDEDRKASFMQRLLSEGEFDGADRITIDGLRLDFGWGWALVRPSNTSPYLIIRFEADDESKLGQLQAVMREQLLALDADLTLPF